jgi:hypothetical protein
MKAKRDKMRTIYIDNTWDRTGKALKGFIHSTTRVSAGADERRLEAEVKDAQIVFVNCSQT